MLTKNIKNKLRVTPPPSPVDHQNIQHPSKSVVIAEHEGNVRQICCNLPVEKSYNGTYNLSYQTRFHAGGVIACFRCSDNGGRAKNRASERAGKNEGRLGESRPLPQSPLLFSRSFARFIFCSPFTI